MEEKQICSNCGTENIDKSSWCVKCLHTFKEYGQDKVLSCPECMHKNSYTEEYCEVCHEPLKPGQWE